VTKHDIQAQRQLALQRMVSWYWGRDVAIQRSYHELGAALRHSFSRSGGSEVGPSVISPISPTCLARKPHATLVRIQTSNALPGLYFLRHSIYLPTTRCQRHHPWLLMCSATLPVLCIRDQHRRYHGVCVSRYGWTRFTPLNLGRNTSAHSRYDSR
jgi:hypothetical protein